MVTDAVLPVKRFALAKQRLSGALDPAVRGRLAEAMAADVLDTLAGLDGLRRTIVVTAEPGAATAARAAGASVVADAAQAGQSAAASAGVAATDAARVLLVPGDCPAMDPAELASLLACDEPVVIVPDRHGSGTNALLLHPPGVIAPAFGPGSFARHAAAARAAGAAARVLAVPSLCHDVDTPEDLDALRTLLAGRPGAAPRTRAALAVALAA